MVSLSLNWSVFVPASTPAFSQISTALVRPTPKIYVSEISILLFRGRSTPAIRAMRLSSGSLRRLGSALPLLVLWVLANHAYDSAPANDPALVTHLPDGRSNLHFISSSTATFEVVSVILLCS